MPLQALSEPEQIISQIASSTFFSFQSDNRSQKQQLLDFLSNKTMLLCIDNWEHLLDGALLLNEILADAPNVKIIATSREKLNLLAETVYVLQGMQFPEWETPGDALRYDAVQLLLQSAQRVKPDWIITEENLDYVARVCRLTQGMPLGILLASSWLDVYSLERICEEIQKSADILETDMRDVPERQRSIRAIFDYSWEGLKPQEQDVLMKMSIFRGGCSPKAAEAITGANARVLQSLVNKALLIKNKTGRYDLHELLRQYAKEKLEDAGDIHSASDSHSHYYLEYIAKLKSDIQGGENQIPMLDTIMVDIENVQIAWRWAINNREYDRMDAAIEPFFIYHTFYDTVNNPSIVQNIFRLARQSLAPQAGENPHPVYGKILSRFPDSLEDLEKALAIAKYNEDLEETGRCYGVMATIYLQQNDEAKSLEFINACISAFRDTDNKSQLGFWLRESAQIKMRFGDILGTTATITEAKLLLNDLEDKLYLPMVDNALFGMYMLAGDLVDALDIIETSLERHYAGHPPIYAMHLLAKSLILFQLGHHESLEALVSEAKLIGEEINNPSVIGHVHALVGMLANRSAEYSKGLQSAQTALEILYFHPDRRIENWVAAMAASGLGNNDLAKSYISGAFEYSLQANSKHWQCIFLSVPAFIIAREGNLIRATELASITYDSPTSIRGYWDIDPQFTQLMETLQTELDEDTFNTAWERGKSLDVIQVIEELLDEFGGNQL